MATATTDVPLMSQTGWNGWEIIDSIELAKRWKVPESWVRNRTRARTPKALRIPCVRLGRYVRFEWGSPQLEAWIEKHQLSIPASTILVSVKQDRKASIE